MAEESVSGAAYNQESFSPSLVDMASDKVLAAELDGSTLTAGIVGRDGKILARAAETVETPAPPKVVAQLGRLGRQLAKKSEFSAAGVAVSGSVRPDGVVCAADAKGHDFPLAEKLRQELRVPVTVTSDRAAAVLGESWKGAAGERKDAVVLVLGETIRAGVRIGGRILEGAHGLAGAAGWMAVSEADGFEVRKFGGLEAFASAPGIVRAAKNAVEAGFGGSLAEYDPNLFTAADIAELARRGDVTARQIYRRAGKQLGLAVANLVSLFDPEMVIVAGSMSAASDLFWPDLLEVATLRLRPDAARTVQICLSDLQGDTVLLGAAKAAWAAGPHHTSKRKSSARKSRTASR